MGDKALLWVRVGVGVSHTQGLSLKRKKHKACSDPENIFSGGRGPASDQGGVGQAPDQGGQAPDQGVGGPTYVPGGGGGRFFKPTLFTYTRFQKCIPIYV